MNDLQTEPSDAQNIEARLLLIEHLLAEQIAAEAGFNRRDIRARHAAVRQRFTQAREYQHDLTFADQALNNAMLNLFGRAERMRKDGTLLRED